MKLPDNPVLFGHDTTPGIVAVEPAGNSDVTVYRRVGDKIEAERASFEPFLWLPEPVFLQGFDGKVEYAELRGTGHYKCVARFAGWQDFQRARRFLARSDHLAFNDPGQQYLAATGRTLFKGMRFDQLHRLQIALSPAGTIQCADNRGWRAEFDAPKKFADAIRERDPDVIEGHDIFRSILPPIAGKQRLKLGRDGSAMTSRPSRVQAAERQVQYPKFQIHGRHIVDTFLLTLFYDVATRELESFELPEVLSYFDVPDVATLSDRLSPSYFVQAQIFPFSYQDVVVRGTATKIDAMLLREYLHRQHAVPGLGESRPFAGGYTDCFAEGVIRDVWHADVQSLYPSLMLAFDIKPAGDELNLFLPLLRDLRQFRLEAKRQRAEALQQTFKILINSFYGYLGFSQAHFADFDAAERVTARGRETLQTMIDWLTKHGSRVIEVDTDGLYFVPPPASEPAKLERELQSALPAGVDVEIDGQFPAMFSYKMKNYALLDDAGKLHMTGSALRSRGLEKFQRQLMEEMLTLALQGRAKEIPALYEEYCQKIERGAWPIEMLAKTETLQDTLENYRDKIAKSARNRNAAYELALKSGQGYQPGDQISYYVTGDGKRVSVYDNCKLVSEFNPARRDENIEYYLDKLRSLYKKFAPLLTSGQTA